MTVWILGDQLTRDVSVLDDADRVLMVEAHAFAERMPYQPQKLTLLFGAMRQFRDELRNERIDVAYYECETFGEGLDAFFDEYPDAELTLQRPSSHGAAERFSSMVEARDGSLTVVDDERFLTSIEFFDDWAEERENASDDGSDTRFRHENFYRHVRRETGILMDGDDPEGGEWNYDDENRETPPDEWNAPDVPRFDPDETTRDVHEWVTDRYDDHWGNPDLDAFVWPVTREQALQALDHFVEVRLSEFGPYQDALLREEWALCHSLLSSSLNLGLLTPREVVDRAVSAYESGDAPLNSVEGFVRQIIGWREFMRHVYRRSMPEMNDANQLDQTHELPELYYSGETEMVCLSEAVGNVHARGYAHHIERLMILSNFALIYGADPHELNRWFHFGFVDAYHWVTTPNVVGMGTFATDALSSKPYASSGNYVNKMSDFCSSCPYAVTKTTGENACPFNALYWDFLKDNEETLRGTGRMGLMYSHVDNKDDEEWNEIRTRAADLRERGAAGEL
ncbi:photolyase [Haloprofundus marisrubri]|uniref:Photolyase n=1 Tax=Haloprofundus marisrubri TaxID=1514971 RepID=A0A0W1RA15_9EURY|nr:cryptochrome/photolyase family protein [Haloprofundus marisrubri]KTG10284.1 photolyase [Haloprofundus marisrubri]